MPQRPSFYERFGNVILIAALLTIPWLAWCSKRAIESNANDVRQWLPAGFDAAEHYEWFLKHFMTDEMIVVSWQGCTFDDPRLKSLAEKLKGDDDFLSAITGAEMLERLTAEPSELDRDEALRRLEGSFVGPDGHTTCLVAVVAKTDGHVRRRMVESLRRMSRLSGVPPEELRMGGPVVDGVAIDEESQRALLQLGSLSALVSLALAWMCVRSVRLIGAVFFTALMAACGSMAVVATTGGRMNAVLIVMPTLVLVLTVAGAIHLINYYLDAIRHGGTNHAADRAVRVGWLPCTLACGTTAVGIGSLLISQVVPVRDFGTYSAAGLGVALLLLLLVLPAALDRLPGQQRDEATARRESSQRLWNWLDEIVDSHRRWVVAIAVLLMAVGGYGLAKIETSVKLQDLFSPRSRVIEDYRWLESNIGALVPMEVVLRFDKSCKLDLLGRVELVRRAADQIEKSEKVDGALSVAVFAPPIPQGHSIRTIARKSVIRKKLAAHLDEFEKMHLLAETPSEQLWRISLRVEALNDLDYAQYIEQIQKQVDPLLADARARNVTGISAVYTGSVPLIYQAQQQLLDDLIYSFLTAFAIIAVLMTIMLGSIGAGVVTMIPNLFPTVIVFGMIGWIGMKVDIGTMMNASITLGIAVDDTLHFLTWFNRGVREGRSRSDAVRWAYQRCGVAMTQTTLICGLGMLTMAFSTFVPSSRFGWMMLSLLGIALVGDLVLLPALLVGPLGRFFEPKRRQVTVPPEGSVSSRA